MLYRVHLTQTVSTSIEIEAPSALDATELVYDSDQFPGGLVYGAFGGGATVDETGDWEVLEVSVAASGKVVWPSDG